jgi:hypothetical protein
MRCLRYVDLNMVRAGKVAHPKEWRWCGYDELTGRRDRYRLLDVERLAQCLDLRDTASVFELHDRGIEEQIARRELARQGHWTESLAVGSLAFVTAAEALYRKRRQFTRYPVGAESGTEAWAVRESSSCYSADSEGKSMG